MAFIETLLTIFLILVIVIIFAKGVVIIQPYEQGLQIPACHAGDARRPMPGQQR